MAAIVARDLGRRFGEHTAVEELSFDVEEGEIFGLLGPNGAGKTTTVRMLCGLLAPTWGEAEVCGFAIRTEARAARRAVGLLTEQPGLYDRLSALENLVYFARLYGVPKRVAEARLATLFTTLGLAGREHDRVGGFSKGMRQKVAIARALVHEPSILFLDEPTSGLDPEASAVVRAMVEQLAREGRTVVLCTHNLDEAARLCRRVAVIKKRILAIGRPSELARPATAVEITLTESAEALARALAGAPGIAATRAQGAQLHVEVADGDSVPELVARVVALGGRIRAVRPSSRELEHAYLELMSSR